MCQNERLLANAAVLVSEDMNHSASLGITWHPELSLSFSLVSSTGYGDPRVLGKIQSLTLYTTATTQQQGAHSTANNILELRTQLWKLLQAFSGHSAKDIIKRKLSNLCIIQIILNYVSS